MEGVFQVRAGDFPTRGEALQFIKKLNLLGTGEAWIVREDVTEPTSRPRWLLVNDELLDLDERTTLYFIPSNPQSYLAYDGKPYRGIFVLRGSRRGLLLINILNVEDYLKGVLPGELSPQIYGEIEAQKAQAVAARTYALKNIGQFEDLGFDLYATPVSQVYDGLGVEHPLSSRAVDETRGETAVYGGRLINALYMSTCGGRTEDGEAMFGGAPVPYLRSTECLWEGRDAFVVRAGAAVPPVFSDGRNIALPLARLAALGIADPAAEAGWYEKAITPEEASSWAVRAAAEAGKAAGKAVPDGESGSLAMGRLLVSAFGWGDHVRTLVGEREALLATKDLADIKPADRRLAAFLLTSGILTPQDGLSRGAVLTRARAAVMIDRAVAFSRLPSRFGAIKGFSDGRLALSEGGEEKSFPLAPGLLLLRTIDGVSISLPSYVFEGGETVKWIERDGRIWLIEIPVNSVTPVLDGLSQYHRWQVRISRQDLEDRLNQYFPVGRLIDLVPKTRGSSQRLLDLLIVGQEGQVHVTGMKIRQVLGLRDNLFVIDREVDADGRTGHFVFDGRGWGHGVGLCQIGAFRMAQKGATYEDILKKYYRGISLEKSV
ncbi:MAG: SpoIID/LytB domain-containing protein [Candidatus Aminicenantes bacterium]|nr:SpoIID/LytB domain-containing protein [Candidatus Aminicenantes bacterium]